jgi:hypothetical protein
MPAAYRSPLPWLLLLLSVTTGLVDAISVLCLGRVFTANMTGNIVFLGFAIAGTQDFHVGVYMIATTAFLAGALVAGRTGKAFAGKPLRRWLLAAALIEAVLLWIAAGVSIGFDIATQNPETRLFLIIALIAMAMGLPQCDHPTAQDSRCHDHRDYADVDWSRRRFQPSQGKQPQLAASRRQCGGNIVGRNPRRDCGHAHWTCAAADRRRGAGPDGDRRLRSSSRIGRTDRLISDARPALRVRYSGRCGLAGVFLLGSRRLRG